MLVLLVDDEPSITQLLSQYLTRSGHEVVCAATVAEAKSQLEHGGDESPRGMNAAVSSSLAGLDAAVIDLLLPDGNGEDLARAVVGRYPKAKVVLATGMAHELAPDLASSVRLLQKPFMPRALLKVLTDGD